MFGYTISKLKFIEPQKKTKTKTIKNFVINTLWNQ